MAPIPRYPNYSFKIPGLNMHETVAGDECAGCFRPIRDRFLLKVLDKPWHTACVRCELCRKLLDEKCFYKEGKMYCKDDFYRLDTYNLPSQCPIVF